MLQVTLHMLPIETRQNVRQKVRLRAKVPHPGEVHVAHLAGRPKDAWLATWLQGRAL